MATNIGSVALQLTANATGVATGTSKALAIIEDFTKKSRALAKTTELDVFRPGQTQGPKVTGATFTPGPIPKPGRAMPQLEGPKRKVSSFWFAEEVDKDFWAQDKAMFDAQKANRKKKRLEAAKEKERVAKLAEAAEKKRQIELEVQNKKDAEQQLKDKKAYEERTKKIIDYHKVMNQLNDANKGKGIIEAISGIKMPSITGGGAGGGLGNFGSALVGGLVSGGLITGVNLVQNALSKIFEISKNIASWAATTAMEYEKQSIALGVMTGSMQRGRALMAELQNLAVETPFKSSQVIAQSKLLVAYGVHSDDVVKTLRQLGDVASGTGVDLERLGLAYGQVISKGRFQATELRQFTEAGVGVADFAKTANMTTGQFLMAMEQGRIGANIVVDTFTRMTSEGGRFNGMMAKINATVGGRLSGLIETFEILVQKFGMAIFKATDLAGVFSRLKTAVASIDTKAIASIAYNIKPIVEIIDASMIMFKQFGQDAAEAFGVATKSGVNFREMLRSTIQMAMEISLTIGKMIATLASGIAQMMLDISTITPSKKKINDAYFEYLNAYNQAKADFDIEERKGLKDYDYKKVEILQQRIARARQGMQLIDNMRERTNIYSKITGGMSDIIPERDKLQSIMDAMSGFTSTFDKASEKVRGFFNIMREADQAGGAIGYLSIVTGTLQAVAKSFGIDMPASIKMANQSKELGDFVGKQFVKGFEKAATAFSPTYKAIIDDAMKEIGQKKQEPSYDNFMLKARGLMVGRAAGLFGLPGGLDKSQFDQAIFGEFDKLRSKFGNEIRNTAPLLESGSQAAISAADAAKAEASKGNMTLDNILGVLTQAKTLQKQQVDATTEGAKKVVEAVANKMFFNVLPFPGAN